MTQVKKEESSQPWYSELCIPIGGFVEGSQPSLLPPTTMTSLQTSQPIPTIFLLPYLTPLPTGVLMQSQPPVVVNTALPPQPASVVKKEDWDVSSGPQTFDFSGYLSSHQLETRPPTFPVAGEDTKYQRHREAPETTLQVKELRQMRNREAAKKSRKKKAQHILSLQNRVKELENENKVLKEYLQALKSTYEAPLNLFLARDHFHVP